MKLKAFFIIFKEPLMKQITQTFSEGVNPTLRYLNFCPGSFDHVGK